MGSFADVSRIGEHVSVLAGLLPGGVLDLIADQITLISRKGSQALGMAFVAGLLISLGSANSGVAALFDALNVVYGEREKRSLVGLYTTTFLFTLAGIFSVIVAITGVVVLPVMLKFVGLSTTTEWLLAILRWPVLFVTIVVGLGLHLPIWPEPKGRPLALGDVGQHPGGIPVDIQFHAVLLVCGHLR